MPSLNGLLKLVRWLNGSPKRGWWIASALVAILGLTFVGLLSAAGVIGKIVG